MATLRYSASGFVLLFLVWAVSRDLLEWAFGEHHWFLFVALALGLVAYYIGYRYDVRRDADER